MIRRCILLSLASILLTPFIAVAQDDSLDWPNNYKAALEEARRTQKPIFLEYRCEP